jgi:hypothetical protein
MQIKSTLTLSSLGLMLALATTGAAFAASSGGIEDAVTKADEAAEAAAKAAEAKAEAAVARDKREAKQGAEFTAEEVSGDMNPVDEGDAAQIKEPK